MKKELLFSVTKKDFDIQTFRSGGKGGQNQDKRDTGVRIIHRESGAKGESRTHRSQAQNKKEAFYRLIKSPKYKIWSNNKVIEIIRGKTFEELVNEAIKADNIKIEIRKDGKWIEDKT